MRNYYAFRICNSKAEELEEELKIGRLHQGWGYDAKLNLRETKTARADSGARKNFPIKNRVKKDDFLFVINMPDKQHVTLARATADFSKGYIYDEQSLERINDLGHIFPAKYLAEIPKNEFPLNTFACRRRFFALKHNLNELNKLIVKYYNF